MVRKKNDNDKKEIERSSAAGEPAGTTGVQTEKSERVYTKSRLTASKRFRAHRDLLQVLLEDSREYTLRQAEDAIRNFSERKAGN